MKKIITILIVSLFTVSCAFAQTENASTKDLKNEVEELMAILKAVKINEYYALEVKKEQLKVIRELLKKNRKIKKANSWLSK